MKLRNITATFLTLAMLVATPLSYVGSAGAQIDDRSKAAACEGIGAVGGNCDPTTTNNSVTGLIAATVNILSLIIGAAAVVMIIIGGFKYVTSNGDSNSITSAKNTILYALVGLVVVALAQFLVRFVLGSIN